MRAATILGAVVLTALSSSLPASAATPSFECTKAESSAEMLVCTDEELAKLDREVARLFALARDALRINPMRRAELIGTQRGWMKVRDECWKEAEARFCVLRSYAIRIHELREGFPEARARDAGGISIGPVAVDCGNFYSAISATFIRSDPAMAALKGRNLPQLVLMLGPSASGARYTASYGSGQAVFWDRGQNATFSLPGGREFTCRLRGAR